MIWDLEELTLRGQGLAQRLQLEFRSPVNAGALGGPNKLKLCVGTHIRRRAGAFYGSQNWNRATLLSVPWDLLHEISDLGQYFHESGYIYLWWFDLCSGSAHWLWWSHQALGSGFPFQRLVGWLGQLLVHLGRGYLLHLRSFQQREFQSRMVGAHRGRWSKSEVSGFRSTYFLASSQMRILTNLTKTPPFQFLLIFAIFIASSLVGADKSENQKTFHGRCSALCIRERAMACYGDDIANSKVEWG